MAYLVVLVFTDYNDWSWFNMPRLLVALVFTGYNERSPLHLSNLERRDEKRTRRTDCRPIGYDTPRCLAGRFDSIIETLVKARRVELRKFGIFEVKRRAARIARNPKTGETVDVPEKLVVAFKPGKVMEEKIAVLAKRKADKKTT